MMKNTLLMTAALGLVLVAGSAHAATPYVSAGAGLSWSQDADYNNGVTRTLESDYGWTGNAAVGLQLNDYFRTELEGSYRDNDVDQIAGVNGNGDVTSWAAMGNLIVDFHNSTAFTPFLGLGAGYANVDTDAAPFGGASIDDSDNGFAYQAFAGVSYDLNDNLALDFTGKYFRTEDLTFRDSLGATHSGEYSNTTATIGLRYSFGAPAAPAPEPVAVAEPTPEPAPVPAPVAEAAPPIARNYVVFFDFDSTQITPEAAAILQAAAQNAANGGVSSIELTGHADRAGSVGYNQNLGAKRANAVKAALAQLGLNPDAIGTMSKGEGDPLVPTADGVREPQNRRVTIVFP